MDCNFHEGYALSKLANLKFLILSETRNMWKNCKFVISQNEKNKQKLAKFIEKENGKLQKTITKNVDYYVQSWNTDDEGKLGECSDYNVNVVSADYLFQCVSLKKNIPFNLYSINEYKNVKNNMWQKLMGNTLFVEPCQESLEYESIPQTIQEFNEYEWKKTTSQNKTIYILPINSNYNTKQIKQPPKKKRKLNKKKNKNTNNLFEIDQKLLQLISDFISSYFCLNVVILNSVTMNINKNERNADIVVNKKIFGIRLNNNNDKDNDIKFEVCDIIDAVLELYENVNENDETLKQNGYAIIGVTNENIFEQESNFGILHGRAFGGSSVAVFSSYHYRKKDDSLLLLLNTISHELLHCFGLDHCTFYLCVMNAWSDIIDEFENYNHKNKNKKNVQSVSAMHLCPIDLKKLHSVNNFNIVERYKSLQLFYTKHGMIQQTNWLEQILRIIQ